MKFVVSRNGSRPSDVGVWVSLDDEKFEGHLILEDPADGPAVRVCSTESKRYKDAYDKAMEKYQLALRSTKTIVKWNVREDMENLALQAAITEWRGIPDEDGNIIEFSPEAALHLLETEPDFRDRVKTAAGDLANYKRSNEAQDVKNLRRSSTGNLNGTVGEATENHLGERPLH